MHDYDSKELKKYI
jgi:hypothetical protein